MKNEVLTPYDKVVLARSAYRMQVADYIEKLFDSFVELKGDRLQAEDTSIIGAIALFHDIPVTVIGHRKGRSTEEKIQNHFGMTSPEGYRKSLRLMKQAEKFGRPVITFVDTPGAYPGMDAESHGQSIAIAENLAKMSTLRVPIITVITGEGNSGGALAIAVADRVWMLENSVYSILSPEGFASILWKDSAKAKDACEVMKLTAEGLYDFGLIDAIIPEENDVVSRLDQMIKNELAKLTKMSPDELVKCRYNKFRRIDEQVLAGN